MPAVILVRHAQASFGGERYDVLSELGHRQVAAVAADLERRGMRVTRILSGDLRRQLDTAEPWAAFAGRELEVDPRFNEYDSEDVLTAHSDSDAREEGVAGVSSREFQTILERALHAWIQAGENGPARVPHPAFTGRVEAAMRDVADGLGSGETALVATSGGVIAAVCARLLGLPASSLVAFNRVTINTGLSKVAVGRSGMTLVSFNEHGHLGDDLLTYR